MKIKIFGIYRGFFPSCEEQLNKEPFFPFGYEVIRNILTYHYCKIDLICYKKEREPAYQKFKNLQIYRISVRKNFPGEIWTGFFIFFLHSWKILLKKYSLIWLIGEPIWFFWFIIPAKILNIPVFITRLDPWYLLNSFRRNLEKKKSLYKKIFSFVETEIFVRFLEIFICKFADAISVVTEEFRQYFMKKGINHKKIYIVPIGTNVNIFKPLDVREMKENIFPNGKIVIGFFGSILDMESGITFLVEVFEKLRKKYSQLSLLIVGDGKDRKDVEKKIKKSEFREDILLFHSVSYLKLPEYINLADICFIGRENNLPMSHTDPLKLYNYMSVGKPVIGGTTRNIKRIIEESKCGYYFSSFDIEDVARKFSFLITDEKKRKLMGKRGREYIKKFRDWKIISENYRTIIEKINNGKS